MLTDMQTSSRVNRLIYEDQEEVSDPAQFHGIESDAVY
jgi:hypothetical protein